jgi:arylsulfatase A-like enzyme
MKTIIIMSDSFRYDHIGKLGMVDVDTPELDALLSDSVGFDNCYAGSFPTVPQRYDMLTGKLGFPFRGWEPLRETDITLAEILLDYGYATQMITDTNEILRHEQNYNRGYIGHHLERGQERDIYLTKMNEPLPYTIPEEKARHSFYFGDHTQADLTSWVSSHWRWEEDRFPPRLAKIASQWIESNYKARDFLLHLDFFDPHEPWDPPDYYVEKYHPDYHGTPMTMPNYGKADVFTAEELKNMSARYKGEVEMVSKWIGFVIRKLKDVGIYDESLIIFTSDHGILLGEHNRTGKLNISKSDERGPWPLYDPVVHVPLMMKMPGQAYKGTRVSETVQFTDLVPTILEIAGIDAGAPLPGMAPLPPREIGQELKGILRGREQGLNRLDGQSMLPLMRGETEGWQREYVFSAQRLGYLNEQFSFSLSPEKDSTLFWITITGKGHTLLIGGREEDSPELYDLESDPNQERNIFQDNKEKAREMNEAFCRHMEFLGAESRYVEAFRSKLKGSI